MLLIEKYEGGYTSFRINFALLKTCKEFYDKR